MSHIQQFNEFNSNKKFENIQPVNEFLGSILKQIFKKAKNRISLSLSKKVGDAKEVDMAIKEYEEKMNKIIDAEIDAKKSVIEFEKNKGDKNELTSMKEELKKHLDNTGKQKVAAKNVFNNKAKSIKNDSDDNNVKDYINLARAELAERLLSKELGELQDLGVDELPDDNEFKMDMVKTEKQFDNISDFAKKVGDKLNKLLSDKTEDNDVAEYKEGDKVKYKRKDGEENEAEVMNQEGVADGFIRLKTDNNKAGFRIKKEKISGKVEAEAEEKPEEGESDEDILNEE